MRVDVGVDGDGDGDGEVEKKKMKKGGDEEKRDAAAAGGVVLVDGKLKVQAWQSFRGHAWDDKGELKGEGWLGVNTSHAGGESSDASWTINSNGVGDGTRGVVIVEVKPVAVLNYYQARSECESTFFLV